MIQNSPEWEQLRKGKLGASDANIIMGVSEYTTPLDLYLHKKGLPPRKPESDMEFICSKGHYLEDKIRAEYEIETKCDFPGVVCIHNELEFLMASMDGKNNQYNLGIEIKYVGQEKFSMVENWNGTIENFPLPQFYPQIQQQYLCSGVQKIALIATTELIEMEIVDNVSVPKRHIDENTPKNSKGTLIYIFDQWGKKQYKKTVKLVPLNIEYIKDELIPKMTAFWNNHMLANVEPEGGDDDIIEIKNKEFGKLATEYKKVTKKIVDLKDKLKPFEKDQKKIKEKMIKDELLNSKRMICKNVKLVLVERIGSIDYKAAFESLSENLKDFTNKLLEADAITVVPNFLNIDLQNFKKASSSYYTLTIEKPKEGETETETENNEPNIPEHLITTTQTETVTVGDISKTIETKTEKMIPIKDKKAEWDAMTMLQQEVTGRSNAFLTEKGKPPRDWHNKDRAERIDYLNKLAKRNDTPSSVKLLAGTLADDLESFDKLG